MKSMHPSLLIACFVVFFSFTSASAQVYDVQVILNKIVCKKAVELWPDTQDDLTGKIDIVSYVAKNAAGVLKKNGNYKGTPAFYNELTAGSISSNILWSKTGETALRLGTGQSVSSGAGFSFNNFSLTQLLSLEFLLGGYISDDEIIPVRYQPCTTCAFNFASGSSGFGSALNYRLIKMSGYQAQLDGMANGTSKYLQFGDDQIMQLDYFESDQNSAHVQFLFKVKVTKKAL